jgi:hypothetical protein
MQLQYTAAPPAWHMDAKDARPLLIDAYGNICLRCGYEPRPTDPLLAVDHIVPVARGGHDAYANYQLLCLSCNSWKGTKVIDFRPETLSLELITERVIIPLWERGRQQRRQPICSEEGMRWVSLPQACRILGIPESTLRVMIRDGKIRAEMRRRSPDSTTDFRRVYDVLVPDMPEEDQQPLPASEPPSAPEAPTDAPAAITALVDALAAERDERQRLAEALLAATERAARAEADAVYAARERQRADDLAETLIALRASLSAKEREAAELREQLARRRWWKPSTW